MFKVYPYKAASSSAKALAQELGAKRIKLVNSRYRPKIEHTIINWGNSHRAPWGFRGTNLLNPPDNVSIASNKLSTFKRLKETGISIPEFTENTELAQTWVDEGHKVYGRLILTGNSGLGIILFDQETITTNNICPLYTKATKCKHEFRVHVMNGVMIDFIQKKKRNMTSEQEQYFNPYIKSHSYGWIFARDGVVLPEVVQQAALGAIEALGLDFGAVDVGYKVNENKAFVYEVNTAPGLEATTLQRYVKSFKENYLDN